MHQEEEDNNQQTSKCYHQSSSSNLHNKDHEMKLICEEHQDLSSKETSHAMLAHFLLLKFIFWCVFVVIRMELEERWLNITASSQSLNQLKGFIFDGIDQLISGSWI